MKKPMPPLHDLSSSEAIIYLDTLVDYYTDVLGEEVQAYETHKKRYEDTVLV